MGKGGREKRFTAGEKYDIFEVKKEVGPVKRGAKVLTAILLTGALALCLLLLRMANEYRAEGPADLPFGLAAGGAALLLAGVCSGTRLKSFFRAGWFRVDGLGVFFTVVTGILLVWNPAFLRPRGSEAALVLLLVAFLYSLLHCLKKTPKRR